MTGPTAPPPPPPEPGPRADEVVRAVVAGLIELLRALREEVGRLQDDAERFVGRMKGAVVRSLQALQRAIVATLIGVFLAAIGAVILAIFFVAVLNRYLGDPWGTGVAALLFLLAGAAFLLRAKSQFKEMEMETRALAERPRH